MNLVDDEEEETLIRSDFKPHNFPQFRNLSGGLRGSITAAAAIHSSDAIGGGSIQKINGIGGETGGFDDHVSIQPHLLLGNKMSEG